MRILHSDCSPECLFYKEAVGSELLTLAEEELRSNPEWPNSGFEGTTAFAHQFKNHLNTRPEPFCFSLEFPQTTPDEPPMKVDIPTRVAVTRGIMFFSTQHPAPNVLPSTLEPAAGLLEFKLHYVLEISEKRFLNCHLVAQKIF